jgi:PASTA domain
VLVASSLGIAAPAAGASSVPISTIVGERYNIAYSVSVTESGSDANGANDVAGDSVWSLTQQWSAGWDDYPINVFLTNGTVFLVGSGQLKLASGSVVASQSFRYRDPPRIFQPIVCAGEVPPHRYTTSLVVGSDGPDNFETVSEGANPFSAAVSAVDNAKCRPHVGDNQSSEPLTFGFSLPDGIAFSPSDDLLSLDWSVLHSSTQTSPSAEVKLFPFSELAAGRSFALESGTRTHTTSDDHGGTVKITEAVEVKFQFLSKNNAGASGSGAPTTVAVASACHVPRLIGRTLQSARVLLTEYGCRLGKVTATSNAPASSLHIVAQSPKAGTLLPYRAPVNVTLA